ncbi:MAG TPA: alpha/beta fold hydrolase [Alphaproteobacteria bacterium]|nr:alpha/beta fold hydrolase [Alphaproteobacteria bacterium]
MAEPGDRPDDLAGPEDLVVLVHGLGRSYRSMARLERHLRRAGYRTRNWDYPSRRFSLAGLIALFHDYIEAAARPGQTVHFVGHSLGGLIIRGALLRPVGCRIGRIVMIGTPNRGAGIVDRLGHTFLPEFIFGPSIRELGREAATLKALGVPTAEIGIIAGTGRWHPFNPSSYINALVLRDADHDGTVEVESTRLDGMADFLAVPYNHTFIHLQPDVIGQVVHFLGSGQFKRVPAAEQGAA